MPVADAPVADIAAFVVARGREGMARVEIAAALGVTLAELERRAEGEAGLAEALALADEAAEAWWLALPRRVLDAGRPFSGAAWRAAMAWRFGDPAAEEPAAAPPRKLAIINIPDNGRTRRLLPDGTFGFPCRDDPDDDDFDDDLDDEDEDEAEAEAGWEHGLALDGEDSRPEEGEA